jgi:hypothetical protein
VAETGNKLGVCVCVVCGVWVCFMSVCGYGCVVCGVFVCVCVCECLCVDVSVWCVYTHRKSVV